MNGQRQEPSNFTDWVELAVPIGGDNRDAPQPANLQLANPQLANVEALA